MIRIVVHPQYGGYHRYPVHYGYGRPRRYYGGYRAYGYRYPRISVHVVGRPWGYRRMPLVRLPGIGIPFGGPFAGPFGPMSPYGGIAIGPMPMGPIPFAGPFGYPEPLIGPGMLPC